MTGTPSDIGTPKDAVDGKPDTLYRTAAVNPAWVQVEFNLPTKAESFFLQMADLSEFRIACADTPADIERRNGSYRDLTGLRRTDATGRAVVRLEKPVTARVFRLDTKRLVGDDYVHVWDWQFCRLVKPEALRVEPVPARPEWKPGKVVSSGGVVRLKAIASAQGVDLDVTDRARFQAEGFRPFRRGHPNTLQAPHVSPTERRAATLKATFEGLSAAYPLTVEGWERKNHRPDVDVLYIERTPRLAYDAPDRGNGPGWPANGQRVEWVAHVRCYGMEARNVFYEWSLDGRVIERGRIEYMTPEREGTARLPWRWDQARHSLVFAVVPPAIDTVPANNRREVATDALTVGFWIEDKLADHWHDAQYSQNPENNSFEDWAQWMIARWNDLMTNAKYPLTPNGLSDRWRLDRVTVVPGGALPLEGGLPSNDPDMTDRTVDIQWGFNLDPDAKISEYWKVTPWDKGIAAGAPAFYTDWALLHELSHARYLIDSYGFDVHAPSVKVLAPDDRTPAVETPEMKALLPRFNKYKGLMGGGIVPQYDEYTAGALERVRSRRARGGNYNSPAVIGEYIQELPAKNVFIILEPDGKPLAGATLSLWRAKPDRNAWYGKLYEGAPDAEFVLDDAGCATLPRNPFGPDPLQHTYGYANTVLLMRLRTLDGRTFYHFQEVSDFNLAYWKGQKEEARYTVRVGN